MSQFVGLSCGCLEEFHVIVVLVGIDNYSVSAIFESF